MDDDILKPVSQGSNGAYDEENRRIRKISDELQRLCRLHEEESREGKGNGSRFEIEQRAAEQYAKSVGMWIPMDKVFDLGEPGPSGNENDTYVSGTIIYKVNNLLNSGGIVKLLDKVLLVLDEHILAPLGFSRKDAWLCDLLPETRLNDNQWNFIKKTYDDYRELWIE